MPSVYVITHLPTKRHYVGKANNVERRWVQHRRFGTRSKPTQYIHAAIRKYGLEEFQFQIVESFRREGPTYEAERFWIEFLRSNIPGCGFNLHGGGLGSSTFSPLTRARISAATRGKPKSSEHKAKLAAAVRAYFAKHPEARQKQAEVGRRVALSRTREEHLSFLSHAGKVNFTPEVRAKMSVSRKAAWDLWRAEGRRHSPVARRNICEGIKKRWTRVREERARSAV